MREDFFTFRPTFKLWLAANHRPQVRGTDHAIWRRLRLIPFNAVVTERDTHLADKLRAELPGILNWALDGCAQWIAHGLDTPASVQRATTAYRANEDVIGRFIDERCELGAELFVLNGRLREAYLAWCSEQGEPALTANELGNELLERGHTRGRFGHQRERGWHGIALQDPNRLPLPRPRDDEKGRSRLPADTADTADVSALYARACSQQTEQPSAGSATTFNIDPDEVI
jgi:putative DNA primase/helicase